MPRRGRAIRTALAIDALALLLLGFGLSAVVNGFASAMLNDEARAALASTAGYKLIEATNWGAIANWTARHGYGLLALLAGWTLLVEAGPIAHRLCRSRT
jgi:hypothetical protein